MRAALGWLGLLVGLVVLGVALIMLEGFYVAFYAVFIVLGVVYLWNLAREKLAERRARGLDRPGRRLLEIPGLRVAGGQSSATTG
jgi:hypothetical protein